jgi:hypothetical protein
MIPLVGFVATLWFLGLSFYGINESGKDKESALVCAYLHPTDRGKELVCREKPPWRKTK